MLKLYMAGVALIVVFTCLFGVVLPYLVSETSTEAVLLGMFLLVLGVPVVIWLLQRLAKQAKTVVDEQIKKSED